MVICAAMLVMGIFGQSNPVLATEGDSRAQVQALQAGEPEICRPTLEALKAALAHIEESGPGKLTGPVYVQNVPYRPNHVRLPEGTLAMANVMGAGATVAYCAQVPVER